MASAELTLEQQFGLKAFEAQVQKMSRKQAQDFLLKVYEQMVVRETMWRSLLKEKWGIDSYPCLQEPEPLEQAEFDSGFDQSNEFG